MNIKKTKEKIIESLEGVKEFEVSYWEEVGYIKKFKAQDKEELEERFNRGELEFDKSDMTNSNFIEDSLEIEEVGE